MVKPVHALVWLISFVFCCAISGQDTPFTLSHHLASKSPYWSPSNTNTKPPNCKPVHIEHVNRHGSRWPTAGDISDLLETLGKLQGLGDKITNPQYFWIKNYIIPYSLKYDGLLSPTGELELYNLGKNYLLRYPEIFNTPFDPNLFTLKSTQASRAGISGVSFAFGLWEGKGTISNQSFDPFFIWSQTTSYDIWLRSQDNCPRWINEIDDNDDTYKASETFSSEVLPPLAKKINQILGISSLDPSLILTPSDAFTLYTACQFDVILWNTETQWCSLLNESDILTLEYIDDLDNWYGNAYYQPINLEVISPLFQEMVSYFDNVIGLISKNSSIVPLASLRFAHSASISPLTAMLGLFKDNYTLTAENYNPNRKWFSSRTSCMGTNIALVLYRCPNDNYLVKLQHNEEELFLPGCGNSVFCPYDIFKGIYKEYLELNFTQLCSTQSNGVHNSDKNVVTLSFSGLAGIIIGMLLSGALLAALITAFILRKKRGYDALALQ